MQFLKSIIFIAFFFLSFVSSEVYAQTAPKAPFTLSQGQKSRKKLGITGEVKFLQLSDDFTNSVLSKERETIQMEFPLASKRNINLELTEFNIFSDDFKITDSKGNEFKPKHLGKFYKGIATGYPESVVVLNVFADEVSGTIDIGNRSYSLTKILKTDEYILYEEKNVEVQPQVECFADDLEQLVENNVRQSGERMPPDPNNCINMYIEIDHDLYTSFGSIASTTNYFNGAFSQVAILYSNEQINIKLQELKVWDAVDPYTGPETSDFLAQFMGAIGSNFNGDLAHLVGTQGGGGIAYVDVVCNSSFAFGYSGVSSTYNNVPNYSWTINVLTHEIGHNLGSSHTHACKWNGNNTQIDDCGNQASSSPNACYDSNNPIIPTAGTIMSYCHLLGNVGMDFNLGFGQQPGDLIRNRVHNGSCLTACAGCQTAATPVLVAPANGATNQPLTVLIDWNASANATSYDLQVGTSPGASNALDQNFTGTAVNLSNLTANTTYYWRVRSKNDCSVSAFSNDFSFSTASTSTPSFTIATNPTSGSTCSNSTIQFDVTSTSMGGFSEDISLSASGMPSGATANFSTNPLSPGSSATVTLGNFGSSSGSYTIQISGAAGGITKTATYALTLSAVSQVPVLVSPSNNASNQPLEVTMSWNAVPNATSYDLQIGTSPGASNALDQNFTGTGVNLTGLAESTTYYWRVRSKNSCGSSEFSNDFSLTTIGSTPSDFTIATSPTSGSTCSNSFIQFDVTSTSIGGFSENISLSASGLPSGATANFSTNPLSPGNSATVTLGNFGSNTGSYTIQISGAAEGMTKNATYVLTLNGTAEIPVLTSPVNGSTGNATTLTLDWDEAANATSYNLRIGSSPGGDDIYTSAYTASSAPLMGFATNTTYYWSVSAVNACGTSSFSNDFSFTTAAAPSFSIATSPTSGSACNNSTIQFSLTSSSIGGFSDDISLTATGLPNNANANFSTNPISPGNSSTVTLSNFGSNTGSYPIQISGAAGGITKTATYLLTLSGIADIPVLITPANNITDQPIDLTLDWEDDVSASSYDVQVSTSPGGVDLFMDNNYSVSSAAITGLSQNTTYYWRVRSVNSCGTSGYSSDFTFTTTSSGTEICTTYLESDLQVGIGVNDNEESSSTLNLALDKTISDLNVVELKGSHSWISDLEFSLRGPDATEVTLFSQICGDEDNFDISFDDDGSSAALPCAPTDGMSYVPQENLSAFTGKNTSGDWTLIVRDLAPGDEGLLDSWGLSVCYETSAACDLTVTTTNPTGPSSLMAAIDCADPGSTITVDLETNAVIDLGVLNMVFDKNLNIESNNPLIIDCPQTAEAIKIMSGATLTLKNIMVRQLP